MDPQERMSLLLPNGNGQRSRVVDYGSHLTVTATTAVCRQFIWIKSLAEASGTVPEVRRAVRASQCHGTRHMCDREFVASASVAAWVLTGRLWRASQSAAPTCRTATCTIRSKGNGIGAWAGP